MPAGALIVDPADPGALARLGSEVRAWEPLLEVGVGRALGRLYDPDATVYAILLEPVSTLATDRRRVPIGPGDLVIVPAAVAIEVEPAATFVLVNHLGRPPHHFRERFIQVWGFEHLPAPVDPAVVVEPSSRGHRIVYEVLKPENTDGLALRLSPFALHLGFAIGAAMEFREAEESTWRAVTEQRLVLWGPGWSGQVRSAGMIGLVTMAPEAVQEAGEKVRFASRSPEYPPPGV